LFALRVKYWWLETKESAMRTIVVACVVLAASWAGAEPFVQRDANTLPVMGSLVELSGWWAASRAAFGSDRSLLPFPGTRGMALSRGVTLEARLGLPWNMEGYVTGGYLLQEVKVDRGLSASAFLGSDVAQGESPADVALMLKHAFLKGKGTTLAYEYGVTLPAATGPDRADHFYDRLGSGCFGFPMGLRLAHEQGMMRAYASVFWTVLAPRKVDEWDGVKLPSKVKFSPGDSYWFGMGVEAALEHFSWSLEMINRVSGRDRGPVVEAVNDAGIGSELMPRTESLEVVPALILPAGKRAELRVAASLPLGGRSVYQMFGVCAALRRTF